MVKIVLVDCNPVAIPMDAGLKLAKSDEMNLTKHPYRALLRSLMYVMLGSRPDICFALSFLSLYQDSASDIH